VKHTDYKQITKKTLQKHKLCNIDYQLLTFYQRQTLWLSTCSIAFGVFRMCKNGTLCRVSLSIHKYPEYGSGMCLVSRGNLY